MVNIIHVPSLLVPGSDKTPRCYVYNVHSQRQDRVRKEERREIEMYCVKVQRFEKEFKKGDKLYRKREYKRSYL